jgi:hypothetical protein
VYTEFWWGHLRERDYLEDRGVDREIKLIRIFRKLDKRIDWIVLALDRNSWRALLNAVMKLRFP